MNEEFRDAEDLARLRMSISLHRAMKGSHSGDDTDYWLWGAVLGGDEMAFDTVEIDGMILIRATNPNAYRSGEWARVVGMEVLAPEPNGERLCYMVEFIDGARDAWPVYDDSAGYEFRKGYSSDSFFSTHRASGGTQFTATETKSP